MMGNRGVLNCLILSGQLELVLIWSTMGLCLNVNFFILKAV